MERKTAPRSGQSCVEELNNLWLTRGELADRWKLPKSTLAQWAHRKHGPRYGVFGRHALYPLSEVIAWEEGRLAAIDRHREGKLGPTTTARAPECPVRPPTSPDKSREGHVDGLPPKV